MHFTDGSIVVEPGDLLLIEPAMPYALEVLAPEQELVSFFQPRPEIVPLLAWPQPVDRLRLLPLTGSGQRDAIEHALGEMLTLARGMLPQRALFAENALEKALLLAYLINPNQPHASLDERVRIIIQYIDAHLTSELSVLTFARMVHLSPSRFAHLFREQLGKGPMEFVEERRLQEAKRLLLSTNKAVSEIAEACGFCNPFHFSRRFHKYTRQSPRDFRHHPKDPLLDS